MHVNLKVATSLDGRIATRTGESQWITSAEARGKVHEIRAGVDGVLVGIGTALADDPALTVRMDGFTGRQPAAIILDTKWRSVDGSRFLKEIDQRPVYAYGDATDSAGKSRVQSFGYQARGVSKGADGHVSVEAVLEDLSSLGIRRILVEGGGHIAATFLKADLVDEIDWFRAPMILGGDGKPVFGSLGIDALAQSVRLIRTSCEVVGPDLWERYRKEE